MIAKPSTETNGLKSAPWVCLAFFLAYLLVHLTVQNNEQQRQQELADWYQQSGLFELEWENYISWLRISGQIKRAEPLEQARDAGDSLTVFRAMAFDPAFERENQLRGDQYWDDTQQTLWRNTRDTFKQRAAELPSVKAGLNPSTPRPSTYLTWHFLNENLWVWLVALLVMLPFAWPVEAELGPRRTAALWIVCGVISGLIYVAFMSSQYLPLTGSTPMAAALIGMYLGLFALRKLDFIWFDPRQKHWRTTPLPAAVLAPLFLILPIFEYFSGSPAAHVWLAQLAGLVSGATMVHLVRQAEVRGAEQETDETDSHERELRQKITSAWASMSAMAFPDAERQFEAALALQPDMFSPLTGLYHIRKLTPESESFRKTATELLGADLSDVGEMRQQYKIFRDYVKRIDETEIPIEVRVKLLANFTRLGEIKEADRLATEMEKRGEKHDLLPKALVLLAQAHLAAGGQARSNHLRMLATRISEAGTD